jgi:hypothetical protein
MLESYADPFWVYIVMLWIVIVIIRGVKKLAG